MTSQAIKFQGSALNAKATTGTDVTNIGEVNSVQGLGSGAAAEINVTHSLSQAKEFLMGLPDEGSVSLGCNLVLDDAGQQLLFTRRDAQTLDPYEVAFPAPLTNKWTFSAYVLSFGADAQEDQQWVGSIQLRISGPIVRT